jgi:hypothetical protein
MLAQIAAWRRLPVTKARYYAGIPELTMAEYKSISKSNSKRLYISYN